MQNLHGFIQFCLVPDPKCKQNLKQIYSLFSSEGLQIQMEKKTKHFILIYLQGKMYSARK